MAFHESKGCFYRKIDEERWLTDSTAYLSFHYDLSWAKMRDLPGVYAEGIARASLWVDTVNKNSVKQIRETAMLRDEASC